MSDTTPQEVLEGPLPEGVTPNQVTAVIVIAEYFDLETGEQTLCFKRDSSTGVWRHLGMLESVRGDFKADLRERE